MQVEIPEWNPNEEIKIPHSMSSSVSELWEWCESYLQRSQNPDNKVSKKDCCLRLFGRWITAYDWKAAYKISDSEMKFKKIDEIPSIMIDRFSLFRSTTVRSSDKPWMTPSLKRYIKKRQVARYSHGKSSDACKYWRHKVPSTVKLAISNYYTHSVDKLKSTNPSRWLKEIKSLCGFKSQANWCFPLLSQSMEIISRNDNGCVTFQFLNIFL